MTFKELDYYKEHIRQVISRLDSVFVTGEALEEVFGEDYCIGRRNGNSVFGRYLSKYSDYFEIECFGSITVSYDNTNLTRNAVWVKR